MLAKVVFVSPTVDGGCKLFYWSKTPTSNDARGGISTAAPFALRARDRHAVYKDADPWFLIGFGLAFIEITA